jgi:hypothetical protein
MIKYPGISGSSSKSNTQKPSSTSSLGNMNQTNNNSNVNYKKNMMGYNFMNIIVIHSGFSFARGHII